MGQEHLLGKGTKNGANESDYQPANLSIYTHSLPRTNSPTSIEREKAEAKSHLCFFSGVSPSKERLFCVTLAGPYRTWEAIHAAKRTGEVRVIGRGKNKTKH
jgi:hypothetical protein